MKLEQTALQKIEFGNEAEDIYYCLIDTRVSPNGLNIQKMKLTDPRNIDQHFRQNGCLLMFDENEINELTEREEIHPDELHKSLFEFAIQEKIIQPD